jgi:hypothetical protein
MYEKRSCNPFLLDLPDLQIVQESHFFPILVPYRRAAATQEQRVPSARRIARWVEMECGVGGLEGVTPCSIAKKNTTIAGTGAGTAVDGLSRNSKSGSGIGWKKLANNSSTAIVALTMLGAHAREKASRVDYREESSMIREMYVW